MDREARDKWLAALRSGKYNQGRGQLRKDHGEGCLMCALGVLIDCTQREEGTLEWRPMGFSFYMPYVDGILLSPPAIYEKLGLDVSQVRYSITMNDSLKMSFDQIADYVEKNL